MKLLTEAELTKVRQELDQAVKRARAQGIGITYGKFGLIREGTEILTFQANKQKLCCPVGAYLLGKRASEAGSYGTLVARYLGLDKYASFFPDFWVGFDFGLRNPKSPYPYSVGWDALSDQGRRTGFEYARHLQADMPEVIAVRW